MFLASSALASDPAPYRAGLAAPSGWEEVDRKAVQGVGEIVVRHKVILGIDCLEGTTDTTVTADVLIGLAEDIPRQKAWSSWDVPVSQKLTPGATSFDYYQILDNPYPINDRYWFLHATTVRDGENRIQRWEEVDPERYPEALAAVRALSPDAVPTSVNVGDWTFAPTPTGTHIRYRICTDAGGNIPRWVGEIAARTTLPTNVADIVREGLKRGR